MVTLNIAMVTRVWKVLAVVSFTIIYAAMADQDFFKHPSNITATTSATVVMKCVVSNRVNGNVQWTKGGFGLGVDRNLQNYPRYTMIGGSHSMGTDTIEEFSLKIFEVQLDDDDKYNCQVMATADEPRGIISRNAYLNVQVPPSQPILGSTTIPVILDTDTNVSCQALNGKPKAQITWRKDGVRITDKVYELVTTQPDEKRVDTTGVVTIHAEMSDAGKRIECGAWNEALEDRGPYWTQATLDVQYAPKITLTHNNVDRTMREFDNVVFECKGEANPYEIIWTWFKNGEGIENENRNILEIPKILRDYHGSIIKCVATNAVGSTEKEHALNILFGPKFVSDPIHVSVDLGDRAELRCQATGNPTPKISWFRQGKFHALHSSSVYVIPHVSKEQFGVYVCRATVLGFNEISHEVYLTENGKPKILSDKTQYSSVGDTARLQCMSVSSPAPEKIVWTRNSEAIDYASSGRFSAPEEGLPYGRLSILQILNVQESDFGSYNCSVLNTYGEDFLIVTLTEKEEMPLPLIIGGAVGGVAVIAIIVIACIVYHRCKHSDNESYADTDSNTEIKKRDKNESPSELTKSTLMDQWRQDYNYRYSADYDEQTDTKANNNGVYGSFVADPYPSPPEYNGENGQIFNEYSQPPDNMGTLGSLNSYNTGYFPSTFRSNSRTDFATGRKSTEPAEPYRLPPADLTTTKLATNV